MIRVPVNDFIKLDREIPVIDVRTPAEFDEGHLPGAINIPVFSNEERAKVGTTYKQVGKEQAIEEGLGYVGPKMQELATRAKEIAKDGQVKVYCWRGGMRSEKMAWLFELVGLKSTVLKGGYKAYRKKVADSFKELTNLIVLQGATGSGKTAILSEMDKLGEQVLDLEGLANHKGSAFGGLGMPEQPTTQQFQNNLEGKLRTFRPGKTIWIESESMTVGRVYLPESLWDSMNVAPRVVIDVSREHRLDRIVEEYGAFPVDILVDRVKKLAQRLGGQNVNRVVDFIESGDIRSAADILLTYYDKSYAYSAEKYKNNVPYTVALESPDPAVNAKLLVESVSLIKSIETT